MTTKNIRLQYTGYIVFAAKLISVVTGLLFQFMLGRSISADSPGYAIWGNINTIIPYFTLLAGIVPFWVMRCVAREKERATKTGFALNLLFSLVATAVYLGIISLILPSLLSEAGVVNPASYLPFYLIASLEIIEIYLIRLFEPCLQASTPQTVGFGLILQQLSRVALGYVLIIQLGQPLIGAMVSTIIALFAQLVFYIKLLGGELKQSINWRYVKEWLKGSVLIIYSVVGNVIISFVFIMLFYYGGFGGMDIYYAALQIATVITYAGSLSFALYPKLLMERRGEDVTASLKTVLMFALPMMVGAIALSSSYIVLLRPGIVMYPGAGWVLVVLALDAITIVLYGIYGSVLSGVETVDQQKLSFKSLLRSKLFTFYSLYYVHSAITIPSTYYVLTTHAFQQPLVAALSVCAINTMVRFVMLVILIFMVRRMFKVSIPWGSISKYGLASAAMGIVLYLLPSTHRILTTLAWTAVGGVVYLAVLVAIDKEARSLPKAILQEIKGERSE